jgi:hypothetical protein
MELTVAATRHIPVRIVVVFEDILVMIVAVPGQIPHTI